MTTRRMPTTERRAQLADAALELLSTRGARHLTVREIAQRVGITDGAVFRHFPDKQAIFDAAIARFVSLLPPPPDDALPPIERLGRFFVLRLGAVQARPEILGLAFSDRLQDIVGARGARQVQRQIKASVDFIRGCVVDAQAAGALAVDVDPDVVVWMVTGAMRGAARTGLAPDKAWDDVRRTLFKRQRRKR